MVCCVAGMHRHTKAGTAPKLLCLRHLTRGVPAPLPAAPEMADAAVVWRRYTEGCSVRILHPQRFCDPLWHLVGAGGNCRNRLCRLAVQGTPAAASGQRRAGSHLPSCLLCGWGAAWRAAQGPLPAIQPRSHDASPARPLGPAPLLCWPPSRPRRCRALRATCRAPWAATRTSLPRARKALRRTGGGGRRAASAAGCLRGCCSGRQPRPLHV